MSGPDQCSAQKQNKKAKPLDDKAWISLFRYNARALRLRSISGSLLMRLKNKYGDGFIENNEVITDNDGRILYNDFALIFEYWHSSLEIVVETYEKRSLYDEKVASLVNMTLRKKLKSFRDSSFHFREDYDGSAALCLLKTNGAFDWVNSLHDALNEFFERKEKEIKERSGIVVKKLIY